MLCPGCKNTIVCKTDPENCDYNYTEGAVRWVCGVIYRLAQYREGYGYGFPT